MYIKAAFISNIRSIDDVYFFFDSPAGWHVLIGDNGAGKSTIIRSIALALVGPGEAPGLRADWRDWLRYNEVSGYIQLIALKDDNYDLSNNSLFYEQEMLMNFVDFKRKAELVAIDFENLELRNSPSSWIATNGCFSVAYGPYRRFAGGDPEMAKIFANQPKLGAHLSAFGEDVALTEATEWLPKDAYPELCYSWDNYFYSCGPCNTKKNNQCAVIDINGQLVNTTPVKQKKNSPINIPVAPQAGTYAFINPETENPMDFFMLDIRLGSFEFSELEDDKTSVEYKRANHTLEVLQLHKKEHLRKGRQHAYGDFKARLAQFIHCRNANAPRAELEKMKEEIQTHANPTVWKEMIRQKDSIPELKNLFDQCPDALLW